MRNVHVAGFAAGSLLCAGLAASMFASTESADAAPKGWRIPSGAKQVSHSVYDIGTKQVGGRTLQGYAIVDRHGNAKPDNPGGGGGGGGKGGGKGGGGSTTSTCYATFGKGVVWKAVEDYYIDPAHSASNDASLTDAVIIDGIASALEQWEDAADGTLDGSKPGEIFGDLTGTAADVDRASITVTANGKNEVIFGPIAEPGVIAVTYVWGVFGGPPGGREIVEWDQVYDDDGDWTWGANGNAGLMDFLNIATHELGHALGLDHPDAGCTLETMYAYATQGETLKRTLHDGDIAGIDSLY